MYPVLLCSSEENQGNSGLEQQEDDYIFTDL